MPTTLHPALAPGAPVLADGILIRCLDRAPRYDRDNAFCAEDFEELRDAGYLRLPLPTEFGGHGLSLAEVAREQRRLAYYAAPTADALTMHFAWVGVAAERWRAGDRSLQWMLEEASRGQVFSAGHAEPGHDVPLLATTTRAERVHGGWRFTGHKLLGSLSPVWSYMGLHGLDASDPARPRIVHAFMPRNTEGYLIRETWDALGMRATRRDDTLLDGAFVPDRYVARIVPAGPGGMDDFVLATFAWTLLGFAGVSCGMARRALDLAVDALRRTGTGGRPAAARPDTLPRVAAMAIELEAIDTHVDRIAWDWSRGVDHGAHWMLKLLAAQHHAAQGAWTVIDTALDLAGGLGLLRRAGIEQLFRDARLARVHPASARFTHEMAGRALLGADAGEPAPCG